MSLRATVIAAAALALVWLALVREPAGSLGVGAIALGAALWVLRRTHTARGARLRWSRLPGFCVLFLRQSLAGGLDVARRVVAADMRLQPGCLTLSLALPDEGSRVLLALVVSLMPGTLAARLDGDRLTVHALDLRLPIETETRHIEREIARLFEPLPEAAADA